MKREPPEEDFRIKRVPGYRVHGCHVGTVCSQNINNSKTVLCNWKQEFQSFWKHWLLQKQNQPLRDASAHQQCGEPTMASQRLGVPLLYQFCLSGTEDFKLEPKWIECFCWRSKLHFQVNWQGNIYSPGKKMNIRLLPCRCDLLQFQPDIWWSAGLQI